MKALICGIGLVVVAGLTGCGGGSGGASAAAPPVSEAQGNSPPRVATAESGAVTITALDRYGDPVPGVRLSLYSNGPFLQLQADGQGRAFVEDVVPGIVYAYAYDGDEVSGYYVGYSGETTLEEGGQADLIITLRPAADPVVGVVVNVNGSPEPAVDGSSLILNIGLLYIPGNRRIDYDAGGPFDLTMDDCQPDTDNDGLVHQADCVAGSAGFDAPYLVANEGKPTSLVYGSPTGSVPRPLAVALLLDQSRRIQGADPFDVRLGHLRYFISSLGSADRVVLTAFAADDEAGGDLSLLPEQPVTFYPLQSPGLISPDETLLADVGSLGSLEGGATPLFESFAQVRQFLEDDGSVSVETARWIVVLADGHDDTCGDRASCLGALQAAADGVASGLVNVLTIGLQPGAVEGDQRDLVRLTEYSGLSLWVKDPVQLGIVFDRLHRVLDGTLTSYAASFRLESPTAGTFQSGRTIRGRLQFVECPFECSGMEFPFSVRIP